MKDDVRTVVPNVPVWAVYYHEETNQIGANPVLWFASKLEDGPDEPEFGYFSAIDFSVDGIFEPAEENDNFLGLSLTGKPKREDWQAAIDSHLKSLQRRRERQNANRDKLPR